MVLLAYFSFLALVWPAEILVTPLLLPEDLSWPECFVKYLAVMEI